MDSKRLLYAQPCSGQLFQPAAIRDHITLHRLTSRGHAQARYLVYIWMYSSQPSTRRCVDPETQAGLGASPDFRPPGREGTAVGGALEGPLNLYQERLRTPTRHGSCLGSCLDVDGRGSMVSISARAPLRRRAIDLGGSSSSDGGIRTVELDFKKQVFDIWAAKRAGHGCVLGFDLAFLLPPPPNQLAFP